MLGANAVGTKALGSAVSYGPVVPYVQIGADISLSLSVNAELELEQQIPAPGSLTYPPAINLPSNFLVAANNKTTRLAEALAIDGLELTLSDASDWPTSGAVTLDRIGGRTDTSSEIVYFDDRVGNVLSLTERGQGGTTAKEWNAGMTAEMRATAEHHNLLAEAIIAVETKLETKADIDTSLLTGLSGDVVASGGGVAPATIANDAVTFAKMQNITVNRLLGRSSTGTGDIEQITLGSGLELVGSTLNAAGVIRTAIDPTADPYNALGDGIQLVDGASVSSSTTFTSASANFTNADVGKRIWIDKVGATGGFGEYPVGTLQRAPLVTTIASRVNATTVVLTAPCQASLSGLRFVYGSDDTAALQAAFAALGTYSGNALIFPAGRIFMISGPLTINRYGGEPDQAYGAGNWHTIKISGYGAHIMCHTSNNFIQSSPNNANSVFDVPVIEGLTLEGIGAAGQTAIRLDWVFGGIIRDVNVRRVNRGYDLRGVLCSLLSNCSCEYFMEYGYYLTTIDSIPCNVTILEACHSAPASTAVAAFYLLDTDMCEMRACVSESVWTGAGYLAEVIFETPTLSDYAHTLTVRTFYTELSAVSTALFKVINNGSFILENLHRHLNPGAPIIDVTGSAASTIVVRNLKVIKQPMAASNDWVLFKQNAANTVGWLFENMGEFPAGETRELTSNTAFWVGGTLPNKATQIEPGRVVTRSV